MGVRGQAGRLPRLGFHDDLWHVSPVFDDAFALWDVVLEREYKGIVAKRLTTRYRPGERGWVKVKNRDYWRYELELDALRRRIERRTRRLTARPPPKTSAR